MQMRFIVDAWQTIEYTLQVFFCIIIDRGYNQAKSIIAMLISKLLSVDNQFAELHFYIMPVRRKKHSHEQAPAYLIDGMFCGKQFGLLSYLYLIKHLVRAGAPQMLTNKVFDA
jgi:hypothetical protein